MKNFHALVIRCFMVIFCVSVVLFPVSSWSAFKANVSQTHIQGSLVKHFPIREYNAFAKITLYEPQVILSMNSRNLLLIIPVDANIPDQTAKQGHARVSVKLSYKPATGGVYLFSPKLIKFDMPGISGSMNKNLKVEISTIIEKSLPLAQIYRIKEKSLNHSLSKSVLKSYSISDDSISLLIGFQ